MNTSTLINEQFMQQRNLQQQKQEKQQQQQQSKQSQFQQLQQQHQQSMSSLVAASSSASLSSSMEIQPDLSNQRSVSTALRDRWAFWFYSKSSSWGSQLKLLYQVSTDVEFEMRLAGMVKPSTVRAKAQLFCMKKGISPDRLDQRNSEGGSWALFIPVDYPNGKKLLDELWYKICRSVVNAEFPNDDIICGAAVVMRNTQQEYPIRFDQHGETRFDPSLLNRDRIELWTWEASKSEIQKQIGRFMKELLNTKDLPLTYRNHKEVMTKKGGETISYTV
eukprot:TRINITY_DN240_c3_g1_i5.p2 TRINITY_DN240_c3_g1~~TRINITY_DN240_c3_g1_i5.p2  ORF type:complete len:277 (-),score=27.27 TRINITY_DN240_c3_g1_i5:3345-4175(-)